MSCSAWGRRESMRQSKSQRHGLVAEQPHSELRTVYTSVMCEDPDKQSPGSLTNAPCGQSGSRQDGASAVGTPGSRPRPPHRGSVLRGGLQPRLRLFQDQRSLAFQATSAFCVGFCGLSHGFIFRIPVAQ